MTEADSRAKASEGYWVRCSKGLDYIWVEDKSGSVVVGEKPPKK